MLLQATVDAVGPKIATSPGFACRPLLLAGLADAALRVRARALQACCALLTALDDEKEQQKHAELVPPLCAAAQALLETDEDAGASAVGSLASLVDEGSEAMAPHAGLLVAFGGRVLQQQGLEDSTRDSAGDLLTALTERHSKMFIKNGVADAVGCVCVTGRQWCMWL